MKIARNGNDHERFSELCALAMSGSLTAEEQTDLQEHLRACAECRDDHERYLLLTQEGMPLLARRYAGNDQTRFSQEYPRLSLDSAKSSHKVLVRIAAIEQSGAEASTIASYWRVAAKPLAAAVAACLIIVASYGAYRVMQRVDAVKQAESRAEQRADRLALEKNTLADQLSAEKHKLALLESDSSQKHREIEHLEARLSVEQQRATDLIAALATATASARLRLKDQSRAASREREALAARLHELEVAYQSAQAERDRTVLRLASLESENGVLTATNRDQERRLRNQEQYLASDRDIRELMGARQLYIADVFDVSSDSRTRKPYGRVFYTKSKSLVFYAFDLDRQPSIKNAAFQAWGRNESSQSTPVNLGILYQDSEQNRRWVLRFDDPQQLAEIDAVFVTVEPNGGSNKPTGKPFLYASLRREPNHP
jgi:hypothetical protein